MSHKSQNSTYSISFHQPRHCCAETGLRVVNLTVAGEQWLRYIILLESRRLLDRAVMPNSDLHQHAIADQDTLQLAKFTRAFRDKPRRPCHHQGRTLVDVDEKPLLLLYIFLSSFILVDT